MPVNPGWVSIFTTTVHWGGFKFCCSCVMLVLTLTAVGCRTAVQIRHLLYCLLFYILTTTTVLSRWVPTCASAYSWRLYIYSVASLAHQATSTMTWYPTQSHYPDTEPTSLCPYHNNAERQARNWQISILKSSVWLGSSRVWSRDI